MRAEQPRSADVDTEAVQHTRGRRDSVKVSVNLLARVDDRLEGVCGITGESRTEAINRSIALYALYHDTVAAGGVFTIRTADGREREFHVL